MNDQKKTTTSGNSPTSLEKQGAPAPLHKVITPATLTEAIKTDSVTVGEWFRNNPEGAINDIRAELILFADVINVSNNLTIEKSRKISELFLSLPELQGVTLAELKVFLRDAFNFKYGQLYGGFGWNDLATWFRAFLEERKTAKRTPGLELPEAPYQEPTPEETLSNLLKIVESLEEVPLVFPFAKVFDLVQAKDPDAFRRFYVEEAHLITARVNAYGSKEGLLARTIGESLKADAYKTPGAIEAEIKSEFVRKFALNHLNTYIKNKP